MSSYFGWFMEPGRLVGDCATKTEYAEAMIRITIISVLHLAATATLSKLNSP
jgi:hypothetical protein